MGMEPASSDSIQPLRCRLQPRFASYTSEPPAHSNNANFTRRSSWERSCWISRASIRSSTGNGRLSRLLTLLGLYKSGYSVGRYVSIERVIADSRDSYYEALQSANEGWSSGTHDPTRWLGYFVGVLLAAYSRFEENIDVIASYRGSKADAITNFVRARAIPVFTVSDVREAVSIASDQHIRRVLHRLRDAGEIESTGTGRAAAWRRLN